MVWAFADVVKVAGKKKPGGEGRHRAWKEFPTPNFQLRNPESSLGLGVWALGIVYRVPVVGTAGFVIRNAGLAPARGVNFCAPPLSTSATYRLPAESTWMPCTPQNPPGIGPHMPNVYWRLPFRSYLIILDDARSNAHSMRDPSM